MIRKKFRETISKYQLLKNGERVLLACSGGMDSTALLALFLEIREERELELFLAHFNHKLRQKAEEDEQFVRGIAQKHSLPLFVGSRDVRSYARSQRLNLEEAGRCLRYDFLKKTAVDVGATKIATGHTMSDQAETFLIRLLRGSGMRGLAGILPQMEGMVIRPLIEIERQEIEEFLKKQGIAYCLDESNLDRRFLRNRIRLDLIPYLRQNFEPKIVRHLSRAASLLKEEECFLEEIGKEKFHLGIRKEKDFLFLEAKFLSSLHPALARRCVRNFIFELKGDLRGVSFADVEAILRLAEGKEHRLGKDLVLRRERGLFFLKSDKPKIEYEHLWRGENSLEIKELGLKFKGQKYKKKDASPFQFNDEKRAYLDWEKLCFPLLVRNRRQGDRYQPLGSPGQRKLKEIMRARQIPVSEREKKPAFLSGGKIVWVLGFPVSENYKVNRATKEIFLIEKL